MTVSQLTEKFMTLCGDRVGENKALEFVERLDRLESEPDISALISLVTVGDAMTSKYDALLSTQMI